MVYYSFLDLGVIGLKLIPRLFSKLYEEKFAHTEKKIIYAHRWGQKEKVINMSIFIKKSLVVLGLSLFEDYIHSPVISLHVFSCWYKVLSNACKRLVTLYTHGLFI